MRLGRDYISGEVGGGEKRGKGFYGVEFKVCHACKEGGLEGERGWGYLCMFQWRVVIFL